MIFCCRAAANVASLGLLSNSCIKLFRNIPTSTITTVMGKSTQLRRSLSNNSDCCTGIVSVVRQRLSEAVPALR